MEQENNGDFSKWPHTVMQTLDDRIGEPRGYKMIPFEDRKQGLENETAYCKSGDGCIPGERGHEGACMWVGDGHFMNENPDNIF